MVILAEFKSKRQEMLQGLLNEITSLFTSLFSKAFNGSQDDAIAKAVKEKFEKTMNTLEGKIYVKTSPTKVAIYEMTSVIGYLKEHSTFASNQNREEAMKIFNVLMLDQTSNVIEAKEKTKEKVIQ